MTPTLPDLSAEEIKRLEEERVRKMVLGQYVPATSADPSAPASMGTVEETIGTSPVETPDLAQQINKWLNNASTSVARANPLLGTDTPHAPIADERGSILPDWLGVQGTPEAVAAADAAAPKTSGLEKGPQPGSIADVGGAVFGQIDRMTGGQNWRKFGQRSAEGVPRLVAEAAAGGAPTIADFGLQGYAGARDQGSDVAPALLSGGIGAAAGAALPATSAVGERMVLDSMERLAPGQMANPLSVTAAKVAGRTAGIGTTMEAQRQGQSLAETGELAKVTPESVVGTAISALPFAAMNTGLGVERTTPTERPTRMSETRRLITDDVLSGRDPSPNLAKMSGLWKENINEPTPIGEVMSMKSQADEANVQGIPDDKFQMIIAGVQGRYNDLFKADPEGRPGPETFNELVKRGHLPKLSKEWVSKNFAEATDQMLGDQEGAKVNLLNRIVAHYEELLPGALEAMRNKPVDTGLSRADLDVKSEQDKDSQYMQAILKLAPFMKDAKVGDKSLLSEFFQRDMDMSNATQGSQLTAGTAWSKYDGYKNMVIKLAETYDPVTRQGMYLPSKRMADGTMLELPAERVSLEDLVSKHPEGGYKVDATPTRKMNRAGSSSALRDAVEFVTEKFHPSGENEDISEQDPEQFVADRQKLLKSGDVEEQRQADLAKKVSTGEGKVEEAPKVEESSINPLGVDLEKTNKEDFYDVALHIMNKVDRMSNAELWDAYGGRNTFGAGAQSPGKFQLFKKAVLAHMESAVDPTAEADTAHLSKAQVDFYNAWRANAGEKGERPPLSDTWAKQREQFRHALRLYWGQGKVDTKAMYVKMLADKSKYLQMLGEGGSQASQIERDPNGGYVVDTPRVLGQAFKGISFSSDGTFPAQSLENALTRAGVTKDEVAYYNSRGLQDLKKAGRVNYQDLSKFVSDNAPRAEVKKLEPVDASKNDKRVAEIRHLAETKGYAISRDMSGETIVEKDGDIPDFDTLPLDIVKLAEEHESLINGEAADKSDAATGRYGVEPKDLSAMPGAVDILVRVPTNDGSVRATGTDTNVLYRGPHFGESDKNVLASVRGYMETLPSGEKVFHMFEVQSDWGQGVQKREQDFPVIKSIDKLPEGWKFKPEEGMVTLYSNRGVAGFGATKEAAFADYVKFGRRHVAKAYPDHPLLASYERLALRAAIDHAREAGAQYVAISDAETAMMTEGHDRQFPPHVQGEAAQRRAQISQEPGMRAAYDVRLPNIMEKLTGVKGQPVEFGEHDKAVGRRDSRDLEGIGSPIFKTPQGGKKTQVTARIYPISQAQSASVDPRADLTSRLSGQFGSGTEPHFDAKGRIVGISHPAGQHRVHFPVLGGTMVLNPSGTKLNAYGQPMQDAVDNYNRTLGVSQPIPTGKNETYQVGMTGNPTNDAMRLAYGTARKLGKSDEDSKRFAQMVGTAVGLFDTETKGVGRLVEPSDTNAQGKNLSSKQLGGSVSTVAVDKIAQEEKIVDKTLMRVFQVIAHELTHAYSPHNAPFAGGFDPARKLAHEQLAAMFDDLGYDVTNDLLNKVLPSVLYPPQFANMSRPSLRSTNGNEFRQEAVSRLVELTLGGVLMQSNPAHGASKRTFDTWSEGTLWTPDQVQGFTNLALREMKNVIGAVKDYYKQVGDFDPNANRLSKMLDPLLKTTDAFLDINGPRLQKAQTQANTLLAMLGASGAVADPAIVITNLGSVEDAKRLVEGTKWAASYSPETNKEMNDVVAEAVQMVHGSQPPESRVLYEHERRMGVRVPPWSEWAGLFYQSMLKFHKAGNPLAESVMYKVNDLEKAYFRLNRLMHDPFLVVDDKGRLKYDPEHPLLKILQKSDPASIRGRQVLSDMARYANEIAKPVLTTTPDGVLTLDPAVPPKIADKLKALPNRVQQGVLEGMNALLKGSQHAADILYHDRIDSTGARIAAVIMSIDKGMTSDAAFNFGKRAVEAGINFQAAKDELVKAQADKVNPAGVPTAQQQVQQATQMFNFAMQGLNTDQVGVVHNFLFGKQGLASSLIELRKFFDKRADWYTTEARPGRIFISSYMSDGEPHYTSAPNDRIAKQTMQKLIEAGHSGIVLHDKNVPDSRNLFDTPEAIIQHYIDRENKAWLDVRDTMEQRLTSEDFAFIEGLGYAPGEQIAKETENKSIQRYLKTRELKPGRELLDMVEAFTDYTGRLAGSVARRGLNRELNLMMGDPRLKNQDAFKQLVKTNVDALMQPLNNNLQLIRTAITAKYLGMPQFLGPMVEIMQSAGGILPYFVDQMGFGDGVGVYKRALAAPYKYAGLGKDLESKRLLHLAGLKEGTDPSIMTKEESMALYYKRQNDEGGFQFGPIYSANNSRNHQMLVQAAFGLGASQPKTMEQMITDPLYWMAQKSMYLYSTASAYNSRLAFAGALDMLYDRGLRGQQLYQGAAAYQNLFTHGGGKANTIGYVSKMSNPGTRSAWGLTETLQRYAFGQLTMQKDMVDSIIGRMDLPPAQRKRAAQAFLTAQFVQLLLAGTMGLSGAAIMATVMQKLTGFDMKQHLREFWYNLGKDMGADDPHAVMLANVAQNGAVSNALGVDVSNRVVLNSMLGFNEYDGFNSNELTGAVSSSVEDLWNASKFVAQGNMTEAGKSFLPPSMRPYINLVQSQAQHGDFGLRDTHGRLQTQLSGGEVPAYALGLKPYRTRLLREEAVAQRNASDSATLQREQLLDGFAQDLMRGNTDAMKKHIADLRSVDPTIQPRSVIQPVVSRAIAAQTPIDPMGSPVMGGEARAKEIDASFGGGGLRNSHLDQALQSAQLGAKAGIRPPGGKSLQHAAMVDALMKQKGMTQGEAERVLALMHQ